MMNGRQDAKTGIRYDHRRENPEQNAVNFITYGEGSGRFPSFRLSPPSETGWEVDSEDEAGCVAVRNGCRPEGRPLRIAEANRLALRWPRRGGVSLGLACAPGVLDNPFSGIRSKTLLLLAAL
jgi:hypothetical protein